MKKFIALISLSLLVSQSAYASLVPTIESRDRYEDAEGVTYERVVGTLAFDSAYPGNSTTLIYGEPLPVSKLGLASVSKMNVDTAYAQNVGAAGGFILFRYAAAEGTQGTPSGGVSYAPSVRGYYSGGNGSLTAGPLVSLPSYDLSALTAVPFEAVGPVL